MSDELKPQVDIRIVTLLYKCRRCGREVEVAPQDQMIQHNIWEHVLPVGTISHLCFGEPRAPVLYGICDKVGFGTDEGKKVEETLATLFANEEAGQ